MTRLDLTRVKSRAAAIAQERHGDQLESLGSDAAIDIILEAFVHEINHELANLDQAITLVSANTKNAVAKIERLVEGNQVK